ncbi:MAG: DNA cytosine methyltransferase [Elusimicrobia bacterium]|nr:DNA cytosine methyltransferase [Elusimicrobiota bacterium]
MTRVADLFCGAGGETTGIMQALGEIGGRFDVAAVNHWDIAIETHRRNHPASRAYCMSLEQLNPLEVFGARDQLDLLWASPECTHHSNARGGRPCSDQSRASAWLILKWLSELYVRRVILENVPEFLTWGPLGSDGRPLKSKKGESFRAFVSALQSLGYKVDWRLLCAADYGDPTTRTRFFLQAVRGRGRISWPEPTHAETPGLFGRAPWRPAREVIDWSLRGDSIFNRARPLAPATMRRIEAGIRRYWGDWAEPFLVQFHGGAGAERRTQDCKGPIGTLDCSNRYGLVQPFMVPFYGERRGQDPRTHGVDEPVPTIPASGGGKFGLIEPFILPPLGFYARDGKANRPRSLDEPVQTITTRGGGSLVEPFLVEYYGQSGAASVRVPLSTVTTKDHFALVEGRAGLDITFRMLQPHELAAAQGFPDGYDFAGKKGDKVKQIGNAVPVGLARALALEALSA